MPIGRHHMFHDVGHNITPAPKCEECCLCAHWADGYCEKHEVHTSHWVTCDDFMREERHQ